MTNPIAAPDLPGLEPSHLSTAVDRALAFLSERQLESGQFVTFGSPDPTMTDPIRPIPETFGTSLVLYVLSFVDRDDARAMTARGIGFLVGEREPECVWRYWTRRANGGARLAIGMTDIWNPPDVDDTACASWVLERNGISCRPNRDVLMGNRSPGGEFYTWIVPRLSLPLNPGYWRVVLPQFLRLRDLARYYEFAGANARDLDGGINANVLWYLGEGPETRPVVDFLVRIIRERREAECDKWYGRPLSIHYFLSRAYFHGVRGLGVVADEVEARISEAVGADGAFEHPMDAALAGAALLNFGRTSPLLFRIASYLQSTQGADGSWPRRALYWNGRHRRFSFGSEEITTALCVEVLHRLRLAVARA